MKHNKFVIYDGQLIFGRVGFHTDLLPEGYDETKVAGGGFFKVDLNPDILWLFGESYDFGPCKREDVAAAEIRQLAYKNFDIQFK